VSPGDKAPKVWFRADLKAVRADGTAYYLQRMQISCSYETYRSLNTTTYRADGSVIESDAVPSYEQKDEPIIPDSVIERLSAVVCAVADGK